MKTCGFSDFVQILKPWLDGDYIRSAYRDDEGHLRLMFVDGGEAVYRIDDCTEAQLRTVFARMKENGIRVDVPPVED
jgi:hypothetical protein